MLETELNNQGFLKSIRETVIGSLKYPTCRNYNELLWKQIKTRLPILKWLTIYDFKKDFISDMAGGLTVGILHIPQGMAYSLLANVPPVVGLYVSFFPVLIYFLMGSSHHLSVGSSTIVCLMIGKLINQRLGDTMKLQDFGDINNIQDDDDDDDDDDHDHFSTYQFNGSETNPDYLNSYKIELAATACFLVGLIQFIMGVLQLGALSVYLSEMLISGFTTGSAIHSITSQIKYLLGISIKSRTGPMNLIYTYVDVFSNIKEANLPTCMMSAATVFCLVSINEGINVPFRHKLKVPVPIELIVIVAGTAVSRYYDFNDNYDIQIVNKIPTGIPAPKLPKFSILKEIMPDSIAIAIVVFSTSISVSKLLAKRHKYDINATQELIAYGTSNIVGSLFSCFPSCASISRSLVQEVAGGKTQMASLLSSVLLLIVLLFFAPLFETLPNCVLAAIIVVALKGMVRQIMELQRAWKVSKLDAAIWIVTFLSVIIIDIEIGLGIGILFSLLTVLFRTKKPGTSVMGCVPYTDVYLDIKKFKAVKEIGGIKIIHFGGGLYFANKDRFRIDVYKNTFNPQILLAKKRKVAFKLEKGRQEAERRNKSAFQNTLKYSDVAFNNNNIYLVPHNDNSRMNSIAEFPIEVSATSINTHTIVIDCSAISFIDAPGIAILHQIFLAYEEVNVHLLLANCQDNVTEKLEKSEFYAIAEHSIFPTIHDAVTYSLFRAQSSIRIDSPRTHERNSPVTNTPSSMSEEAKSQNQIYLNMGFVEHL